MKKLLNIIVFVFLLTGHAWANMNMSVLPADGSRSLRFERMSNVFEQKKDVRIRITATNGQRYQVFQRVLEPIVNEKGQALNLNAIKVASSLGSNAAGTLYLQSPETLSLSETLVYSSSQAGDVDSFVLGYVIDPTMLNAEGRFFGKLLVTLRPLSGGSQQQEIVDVLIESQSNLKTSIKGNRHIESIKIKDTDHDIKTADFVKIDFSGNKGEEIKIYQEIVTPIQHEQLLKEIDSGALQFMVNADAASSSALQGVQSLNRSRVLLYSSRDPQSAIGIHFLVNDEKIAQEKAGIYRGKIKYTIETSQGQEQRIMDLSCEIQPIFNLDVVSLDAGLKFDDIQQGQPPVFREIIIKVRSNLEKPYQVVQELQAPLTNEKGQMLETQYFTMKIEFLDTKRGHSKVSDFTPIKVGSSSVFASDRKGSSAEFKVIYRLEGYPRMPKGGFSAPIRFSLNQN